MADDIDIEEHNVLDDPQVRDIFPDLTRVKIEEPDIDDDGDQRMENASYKETRVSHQESTVSHQSSLQFKRSTHKNHIILGSKCINYEDHPPISKNNSNEEHCEDDTNGDYECDDIQIKQEPKDSHNEENERHGSCIIFGSKPNRSAPETETHNVYSSVIMLEDWGPKLQHSNCYCKDCEILFPTRNCLDAHNMTTHSFLVALSDDAEILDKSQTVEANVSVNKAKKSTAKNVNFSTASTLSDPSTSKGNFCSHCNKKFPSKTALIEHLYENLMANKFPCKKCDRIFNKEPELIQHIKSRHAEEDDEDTSDESEDGLYYQCDVCFCYFRRTFSRHMLKNHGKSRFSTKRVPFSGICKLCGLKCSTSTNLNKHVSRKHSQYNLKSGICKSQKSSKALKSKITHNLRQVGSANNPDIRRSNFQCMKCGQVFAAYGAARHHKRTRHPEMLNQPIFKKIKRIPLPVLTKKSTEKTKIKDKTTFVYNGVSNPPVPKSVLFKCSKCSLHFVNCNDAVFHAYRCVKEEDVWDCDVCCRRFKISDKIIHERQHIISDTFFVHLTNDDVYGRTLCQCPKCEIYYSEQEFWVHVRQGCSQPRSAPCNICDILIHVSSTNMHKKLHESRDINTKDLILIEFFSLEEKDGDNEENVFVSKKRKLSDDYNASYSKKSKITLENHTLNKASNNSMEKIMYYCEKCKTYWRSSRTNIYNHHRTGDCVSRYSRTCKKCGLFFTSKHHDRMMHTSGETIFDFTFIRVQDNKIINPMPAYPKCLKCNVHSLNKKKVTVQHHCNNDYLICEYCEKMFDEATFSVHVTFHDYALGKQRKTGLLNKGKERYAKNTLAVEKPSIASPITQSGKSLPMPELLKKYELMTNTWNILYLCEVCDIVCDSYDKMVEHSQDHFNKIESYDMIIANCEICDLRFDGSCFDKHKDMHDENALLNREFFNILKYNYMNLFSDNWFELFDSLPRTQIEQIVSQSIYVRDRNIKMRITQHGSPENTVYKCGRCKGYLTVSMVGDHFEKPNCWSPRYRCKLCLLNFYRNVCLKEHQTVCRTTHQSYREVLFNDASDDSFNRGLQMTQKSKKSSTNTTRTKTKDTLYKFYKCEICQCCVPFSSKLKSHKCAKPSERVKCGKCDLYFKTQTLYHHKPLHIKFPKLSKKTVMVIFFKPKSYKSLPKLYKCRCGLHFTSLQTAEKHLTLCKPGYQISRENCSKCGLLFPTSVLVSHSCSHHSNDKQTEFNIQHMTPKDRGHRLTDGVKSKTNPKVTIHKCAQCDLCFLSKASLTYHFFKNHENNLSVQHCTLCGVNFTKYSMTRHVLLHHKLRQWSQDALNVKIYSKIADQITEQPVSYDDVNYKTQITEQPASNIDVNYKPQITEQTASNDDVNYRTQITEQSASNDEVNYKTYTTRKQESHETMSLKDSDYYSKYLYQCRSCKLHFLRLGACTSHYIRYHERKINAKQEHKNCHVCGLAFALPSLVRHTQIHHEKMNLNREDFIIIQSQRNVHKELYRCDQCDVHFLTLKGYLQHCSKGLHSVNKMACDFCGYNFTKNIMPWHISVHHHSRKLSRNDFNVITAVYDGKRFDGSLRDTEMNETTKNDPEVEDQELSESIADENKCQRNNEKDTGTRKCKTMATNSLDDFNFVNNCMTPISESSLVKMNENKCKPKTKYNLSERGKAALDMSRYDNTVYLCSCGLNYMTLRTFKGHLQECNKQKNTSGLNVTCKNCGFLFSPYSLSLHQYIHHEKLNIKLEDFRIMTEKDLEQSGNTSVDNYEVSADFHNGSNEKDTESRKCKTIATNRLYRCRKCSVHFCKEVDLIEHVSEASVSGHNDNNATTCQHCHLKFTPGIHIDRHINDQHESLKLTNEFVIIENDIVDGVYMSRYLYKCDECNINFVSEAKAELHDHPIAKCECRLCGLLFSLNEYRDHKTYHHNLLNMSLDDFHFVNICMTPKSESSTVKMNENKCIPKTKYNLSERGKAALHMSRYDNTVYLCSCGLHYLTLKTYQKHLQECNKQIKTSGSKYVTCKNCGFLFSPYSLSLHQYVHHERLKIKLEDFRIVTEKDLEQDVYTGLDNYGVSADLHQEQTGSNTMEDSENIESPSKKVISKPGFNFSKSYLSSLNMDSFSNQLYRCKICNKHYITFSAAMKHDHLVSGEECSICGLLFTRHIILKHIYIHHERWGLSRTDFIIQRNFVDKPCELPLYKCDICNIHFIKFTSAHAHTYERCEMAVAEEVLHCEDCGLRFSACSLETHQKEHHRKRRLKLHHLNIIYYSGATRKTKDIVETEDISNIENSTNFDESEIVTDKVDESEVGDVNELENSTNFDESEIVTDKVDESEVGDVNELENSTNFDESEIVTDKVDESEVGDVKELEDSINFDESENVTDKVDEYEVGDVNELETISLRKDVSLDDLDSSSSKSSPQKNLIKLYKCGDCNVFYITQNTCYRHVLYHKQLNIMDFIECKFCGLQFPIYTLHKHMIKHHKSDFNLKNVLVEEYRSVKNETPKVDIYYALDKVQSRLVSTTTDSKAVSEERVDSTVEVRDVVGRVDGQENIKKDNLNTDVEQIATTSTAKNTTGLTVTEDITKYNSPVKEQIVSESTDENLSAPVEDDNLPAPVANLSMTNLKANSSPFIDQIVTASPVKNVSDASINKTVTETHVKDVINNVVDQMLTENTVSDNINASAKEALTGIDV